MGEAEAPAEHERCAAALGMPQQVEQPGEREQQRVQVKGRQGQGGKRAERQRRKPWVVAQTA